MTKPLSAEYKNAYNAGYNAARKNKDGFSDGRSEGERRMKWRVIAHFRDGKELVWLRKIIDELNKPNELSELYGDQKY